MIRHLRTTVLRHLLAPVVAQWQPYSRLLLVGDGAQWVLNEELRALRWIMQQLGVPTLDRRWLSYTHQQAVFYAYAGLVLPHDWWRQHTHRIGFAYYHGLPGTGEAFDQHFARIRAHHQHIARILVSHAEMHTAMLDTGIDPHKVWRIPIGINPRLFAPATPEQRAAVRRRLNIPDSAVVIGSFQKDGQGWGEGREPKLIKGPDVLLETLARLKPRLPDMFVLLSGPARGYVRAGLERLNIPYQHRYLQNYADIAPLYHALDLYLVTSRQEGGPKAVLESLASGVPLVSTRVGQATDLIRHGSNGWLTAVADTEALAYWADYVLHDSAARTAAIRCGLLTSQLHTYPAQIPLWRRFVQGFVGSPVRC